MTELAIAFSLIVVGLGAFVWWQAPTKKVGALALMLLYSALWLGLANIMGRSSPICALDETQIISYHFDEPEAVHVWVLEGEPRACRLPWSQRVARKLMEADREAGETGEAGTLVMRWSIQEGEYEFHTQAPRELPPKTP